MPSRSLVREAALLLAYLASATFVLSLYGHSLNMDSSAFLVVGRGWLAGVAPYSGLWDDKPPAVYILAAIAGLMDRHGDGVLAFRALSIGSVVVSALTLDRIVRNLTARVVAGVATALLACFLLACPELSLGGGLTETFAIPGMSIALLAVLKSASGSRRMAFVAGAGLGWAVSCSLLSLGVLPALAYVWLFGPGRRTGNEPVGLVKRIKPGLLLFVTLGGAVVCAVCWAPVLFSGSLGAGLDAVITYKALYRALAIFEPFLWSMWLIYLAPLWFPALITAALIRKDDHPQLTRIAVIWIAGELGWLLYGERFYTHYLLLLMAPAAMLAVAELARCRNLALRGTKLVAGAAYVACVLLGTASMINGALASPVPEALTNQAVANYIDARTAQSDGIYVWGYSPDIYLSADRMPRGRFFYLLPLSTPGFGESGANEVLEAWGTSPPIFIVDASYSTVNHGAASPLLVDHPGTVEDRRTATNNLDGLRAFVRDHYDLSAVFGDKRVYRYRG